MAQGDDSSGSGRTITELEESHDTIDVLEESFGTIDALDAAEPSRGES